jgi:tryptophan-rich sensory protein
MGYLFHILVPIIIASLINLFIYVNGWSSNTKEQENKYLPPGYVIGIVWIIILGLLGYANYLTYPTSASWIVIIAIIYCLFYPFLVMNPTTDNIAYKILFSKPTRKHVSRSIPEWFYNLLAFIIAVIVAFLCYREKQMTIYYTMPFVLWTTYVNIVTNL